MLPGFYSGMGGDSDVFITNFSEYAVGVQPADWTSRFVSGGFTAQVQTVAGSLSGKAMRWTKTAANLQAMSWDKVPASANVDLLVRCRAIEAFANTETFIGLAGRGAGAAASETLYAATLRGSTANTLAFTLFNRYVAGTLGLGVGGIAIPAPSYTVNSWMWMRFNISGTTLSKRSWHSGVAEPAAWDEVITDTAIAAAGWSGLYQGQANPNAEIDFFGVALNGKTVPLLI